MTRRSRARDHLADCDVVAARISAYLDGQLPADGCRTLRRHCRSCPRCAALVADLERVVGLCRTAGATPLPKDVRARARREVKRLLKDRT